MYILNKKLITGENQGTPDEIVNPNEENKKNDEIKTI